MNTTAKLTELRQFIEQYKREAVDARALGTADKIVELVQELDAYLTGAPPGVQELLPEQWYEANDPQLAQLKQRLAAWYRELLKADPNLEDGESMSIEFEGGRVGHGRDDEPLYQIGVATKRVEQ